MSSSMPFLPIVTLLIVLVVLRQQAEQRRRLLSRVDELTYQVRQLALQCKQRGVSATGKPVKPASICEGSCSEPCISCAACRRSGDG